MSDLTNPLLPRIAQVLSLEANKQKLDGLIADSRWSEDGRHPSLRRLLGRSADEILIVPQEGISPDPMPVSAAAVNTASYPRNSAAADQTGSGAPVARYIEDIGH